MRVLMMCRELPWPLFNGRAINAHHLARCLLERGHSVRMVLGAEPAGEALRTWPLQPAVELDVLPARAATPARTGRWHRYWGVPAGWPAEAAGIAADWKPDYVEACGLETALWCSQLPTALPVVWLLADDPGLPHLTRARDVAGLTARSAELRTALTLWAFVRSQRRRIHAAVSVAPADARLMRWMGGFRNVLLTPNGVDLDYFRPAGDQPAEPATAVFWGRLDFGPNIDAIDRFLQGVWPRLVARRPEARFRIIGQAPAPSLMERWRQVGGVDVVGPVEDLRPWVYRSAVAVLPLRQGAGIKNKLLEAAAMGKAIVASPAAVAGLRPASSAAWRLCHDPVDWSSAISELWDRPALAHAFGVAARQWASTHHRWDSHASAREALIARLQERFTPVGCKEAEAGIVATLPAARREAA